MKYLCINCKEEFDELPPKTQNECISGYYHDFIEKSAIIDRDGPRYTQEEEKLIKERLRKVGFIE